jgi:hypothetical protein
LTEAKIVVACRIRPDLKAQLEDEAAEREDTLSSYMEFLIEHRDYIFEEQENIDDIDDEPLEAARQYIGELENEKTALENEVNRLLSLVTITNRDLADRPIREETTKTILSEPYKKAVLDNLEIISQRNPDYSLEQLLLASTGLALKNGTFTSYNLKDYLKKFKHLYHLEINLTA